MSTASISRRYARALFDLQQDGTAVAAPLSAAAAVAAAEQVVAVLERPDVPAAAKAAIIDKAAGGLGKEVNRLVQMLCERNKAALLPEINAMFESMVRQATSEVEAEVVTATPLTKAAQDKIAAALTKSVGRKVIVTASQDKDIIGGLVVRLGDRQIDYSLRTRLDGLKRAMVS